MKRIALTLLTLVLTALLCGCAYKDPIIQSLSNYERKEFYTSGGFQDFTDYAKYVYPSTAIKSFENSRYFRAMTAEDVEEVLLYIENFEMWVEIIGGELQENYDFDKSSVIEGDFLYIETNEGSASGKFDNYSVYYFCMDTQVLYYFHNNI